MVEPKYRSDPYAREIETKVVAHTPEGGVILAETVFYPTGGGQPGDSGVLQWQGRALKIATTVTNFDGDVVLVPAEPVELPALGHALTQTLDWERRYRHMRVHTALHLLSVVIPLPVTGGAIGAEKGRLDFDMPEASTDKEVLQEQLNELIERDLRLSEHWISDDELRANPDLVRTMSVQPPMGSGRVRLIRIGDAADQVDLQPCGGTHVARTGEIGRVRLGKIEKNGQQNRRVYLHLDN